MVVSAYAIEIDEEIKELRCGSCGSVHPRVHGFIYRDNDAWAVYWADLYQNHLEHPDPLAVLTIAVGDRWDEENGAAGHSRAQLHAWPTHDQIQMGFVDPEGGLEPAIFGEPLTRAQAIASSAKDQFLRAADVIVARDHRVVHVIEHAGRLGGG